MTDTQNRPATVTATIDGREVTVPKGTLIIRAAEELGIVIPRFCDHPLLAPVAACRQCMVEIEGQRKPMTACSTPLADGNVVKTHLTSDMAKEAQEGQLEFLLVNHPLDCPQCDKGGECPLQDQALAHGAPDSRFVDDKRRFEKSIPISPQILLDREKCVLCARCTRFSQEISGDPFIELFERGALEQVAIYEDEPYQSYYSGNVVQICPVGALTATSYRFHARPFDLQSGTGVCNQCASGCNLRVDVRRGEIQRQLARDNMAVNETWSCDKGRFGFEYVGHADRLREPAVRDDLGNLRPAAWVAAVRRAAAGFRTALEAGGPAAVGVLTGGRITDEDAYAVSRFAREVLGTDNVDFRLRPRTDEEREVLGWIAGTVGPTYDDVEQAPVVVVAGLDTEEESPILHLRLRKAVRQHHQKVVVVGPVAGSLAEIAWRWVPTRPGDEAAVLAALAGGAIDAHDHVVPIPGPDATRSTDDPRAAPPGAPAAPIARDRSGPGMPGASSAPVDRTVADRSGAGAQGRDVAVDRPAADDAAARARAVLDDVHEAVRAAGDQVVVLAGDRLSLSPGALRAAAGLGRFAWVPRKANARGAVDAGLLPGLLPGGRALTDPGPVADAWKRLPDGPGLDTRGMLEAAARGEIKALYLVGVDPARDFEDPVLAQQALERVDTLIVQDLLPTLSTRHADVLLPAQSAQERVGSFTTWEGRRQGWQRALEPVGLAQEDWDIVSQIARALGANLGWERAADVRREAAPLMEPAGRTLEAAAVPQVVHGAPEEGTFDVIVLDYLLGRGSMLLGAKDLNETARPASVWLAPVDAQALGVQDGTVVSVTGDRGQLELPVRLHPGVVPGAVVVPANSTETPGWLLAPRVRLAAV